MQFILESGDGALGQGDGAGQGREKYQDKEHDADRGAEVQAGKDLGYGYEHQGRARPQGLRVSAGKGEYGGNDHQRSHKGNARVKDLDLLRGVLHRDIILHIGTEGDQDAHGDGQGEEHLLHGRDHSHPGKIGEVGDQQIFDALHGPRSCAGINRNNHGQNDQDRHHEFGYPLNSVADAQINDDHDRAGKDQEKELCLQAVADEIRKVSVLGHGLRLAGKIAHHIFDDPAADGGIIGHDQHGNDGVDPAAQLQGEPVAEKTKGSDRALFGHTSDGSLRHDHGIAEGQRQNDIDQQEDPPAVFGRQIGKPPDIAQSHRSARG